MTAHSPSHPLALLPEASAIFRRDLLALRRNPALVAANLAAPIGLVLVFGFVFGGALEGTTEGPSYIDQIIPAAFVLVAGTGTVLAAGTAALDLRSGVTDRLRTMPILSLSVPLGASLSQLLISAVSVAAMTGVGLLLGWRPHDGPASTLVGFTVLLLFGYALTWAGILLGLVVRDQEVVQQLAPLVIGAVLVSNAFVPTSTMPDWLAAAAEWNPFSAAIAALRDQFGSGAAVAGPWPLAHPVLATTLWSALLILVCAPSAARRYGRRD